MPCDHLDPDAVRALVQRVDDAHGRLDVLVNDIWGGEMMVEWEAERMWSPRTTRCG